MFCKRLHFVTGVAVVLCLLGSMFVLADHKDGHSNGGGNGGGGDGGGDTLVNPALVYVETDAIITIATADGQVVERLTGATKGWSIKRSAPVWSPDGTMIAYVEDRDDDSSLYPMLYMMNADGSNPTLVHNFAGYPERHTGLTWLSGSIIHFSRYEDACFLDLLDGSVQCLGLNLLHSYVGPTAVGPGVDPSLPGASGLVAYAAVDEGVSNDLDIYIGEVFTDFDGSLLLDPTTITRLDLPGRQNHPVVSPDGLQIAFYDDAHADGGDTLAVVDLLYDASAIDFGAVQTLLEGTLGEFRLPPTWSPDSQWIAFTWQPDNNLKRMGVPFEIARIRPDGTDFTNVTNSSSHEVGPNWNPTWDPNGP
ncbi:MAG TPA: hypothetical protein VMM76_04010 [Pirellulaceae bacterium]|nr:hypothetical protein [Pirellulaceae bacterium]